MKKDKKLIVANWKANPDSLKLAKGNLAEIKKFAKKFKNIETVVCPPLIFLESLKTLAKPISLGAQDIFTEPRGAFTGSVGYASLVDTKIKYVIIGHSERRSAGDYDSLVNNKLKVALMNNLTPILCVGELKRDPNLEYLTFIKTQLTEAFRDVPKSKVTNIIVAYEPVWAVGASAKRDAKPSEIEEMVILIKRVIGDIYKTGSVPPIKVLYGGSVTSANAEEIIKSSGVDGFLVGRASLTPKIFGEIIKTVSETK
jgi:triosephosphate isomerase